MEIQKDIGEEIIEDLKRFNQWAINMRKEVAEKDKRILDLETKIKEYENGSKK